MSLWRRRGHATSAARPTCGPGGASRSTRSTCARGPGSGLRAGRSAAAELQPFYVRAQQLVEAGPFRYDLAQWLETVGEVDDLSAARLEQTFWQKSPPTRFGQRYLEPLRAATNITVLLNANLTGIRTRRRARASSKASSCARCRASRPKSVRAAWCSPAVAWKIRACCSRRRPERPHGLGNEHDLVGRYFMEHPWFHGRHDPADRTLHAGRPLLSSPAGGHLQRTAGGSARPSRRGSACRIAALELGIERFRQGGIQAAGKLWRDLSHGSLPTDVADRVVTVLSDIGGITESVIRKLLLHRMVNKPPERLTLQVDLDPKPDPDSRVTLDRRARRLGHAHACSSTGS